MRNDRNIWYRIFLNTLLLWSVLFLPWWVSVFFMVSLLVLWKAYEVLFWGFLIDVTYGASVPSYGTIPLIFTLLSVLLFIAIEFSKKRIIFYTG